MGPIRVEKPPVELDAAAGAGEAGAMPTGTKAPRAVRGWNTWDAGVRLKDGVAARAGRPETKAAPAMKTAHMGESAREKREK